MIALSLKTNKTNVFLQIYLHFLNRTFDLKHLFTEPSAEVMEIKGTSRQHRLVSNSKRKRCSSLSFSLKGAEFESDVFISWGKAGLPAPHPDFLPATSGLFLHILSMQGTALSFDVNVCLSQACHVSFSPFSYYLSNFMFFDSHLVSFRL